MISPKSMLLLFITAHSVLSKMVEYEDSRDSDRDTPTDKNCIEHETFNLTGMNKIIRFDGNAHCTEYEKVFRFNPDLNAKSGHVLYLSRYEGESRMTFEVTEFTTFENGTIDRMLRRPGNIVSDRIYFAANTGILMKFTRDGSSYYTYSYTFNAIIAETAPNHNCPYPFIDLKPYTPVILEQTVVMYHCEVLVTAPPDYEIRIDHMKDTDATHRTAIKIYEDRDDIIQRFENFPVEETMTGSRNLTIEVFRKNEHSHQVEIQISAVKLNCTCDSADYVFNSLEPLTPALFQCPEFPKKHCKMTPCQRTFVLPVELRSKYKMKFSDFTLPYGTISVQDGVNGPTVRSRRENRQFIFESPTVTLKYDPGDENGATYSLELTLVERLAGCECPHQPTIATNIYVEIPAHCKDMDCIYLLPEIDDNTAEYQVEHEYSDYIVIRSQLDLRYIQAFEDKGSGTWESDDTRRMILRVYREKPASRPAAFNLTYTSSGVHISHAERCGCLNKTVLVEPNQAMDVASPHWPSHYCNNLVCVTTFVAPAHHHLEVKLDAISLEPDRDRVAFFDGTNITGKHIEVVTGELLIPDPITSSDTVMTIVFISNGAVAFDGFNGTIRAVMDKSWSDHFSAWWWILAIIVLLSIISTVLYVRKRRGGIFRSRSMNLMDL